MPDLRKKRSNLFISKTPLWHFPWKYRESFIIAAGLIFTGFLMEAVAGREVNILLEWPYNLFAGLAFIILLILVHISFKNHQFIKWLSGIPACISAISVFSFMAILLGLVPQDENNPVVILKYINLSHLNGSFPFLFSQLYFITALGFVILRRARPIRGRNIGFLLNHAGLWIIIFAALIGAGDLKRLSINLYEDKGYNQVATDNNLRQYKLPFSLRLIDFNIEEYNPKLVIFNNENHEYITGEKKTPAEIKEGAEVAIADWDIKIKRFIPLSFPAGNAYESSKQTGSSPSALVFAVNNHTHATVSGWITCGSYIVAPQFMDMDGKHSLAMTIPEPKKYRSLIEVNNTEKMHDTINLIVNKPVNIKGWKLYQVGYNSQMGSWSVLSVIELVSDPWLPVVYTGIFMLLAGAVYMFWIGKETKD